MFRNLIATKNQEKLLEGLKKAWENDSKKVLWSEQAFNENFLKKNNDRWLSREY